MKYIRQELIDWAIQKIKSQYQEDVSLLIGHSHWNIDPDGHETSLNFFIPETQKGYSLSETFIIDEIGYDLFPMSWERVAGMANLNEGFTTCLADGVVLYARSEADRIRFTQLQAKLQENLMNPEFTYKKGLEKINTSMDLYKNLVFEQSLSQVRKAGGYIADYLSQAIAAINGTYFKRGPENHLLILGEMKQVPKDFIALYQRLVNAKTQEDTKELSYQMIETTRQFFSELKHPKAPQIKTKSFEGLAEWYEEGSYTFRRIYYYCEQKDAFNTYAWGVKFQQEFDSIQEEFRLEPLELMCVFNPENLEAFHERAKEIEYTIRTVLLKNKISLNEYADLDAFLKKNS